MPKSLLDLCRMGGFWGGAQAGVEPRGAPCEALQMSGNEGLAVTGTGGC